MFAYNGTKVNMSDTTHPFVVDYLKKTKIIKAAASQYDFRYHPRLITPKDPMNPESREGKPSGVEIKWTQRYQFGDHSGEVTYYETVRRGDERNDIFTPRSFDFTGQKIFTVQKDLEKIFFMIYVNQFIEVLPNFPGQNEIRHKSVYMILYQEDLIIRKQLDLEEKILKARSLVLGTGSLPLPKLKIVARVLNYRGIDDMTEDQLRYHFMTDLFSTKNGQYNEDKISQFIDVSVEEKAPAFEVKTVQPPDFVPTDVISSVKHAQDLKVVEFVDDRKNKKKYWRVVGTKEEICQVGTVSTPEEATSSLIEYLSQNQEKYDKLKAALEAEVA